MIDIIAEDILKFLPRTGPLFMRKLINPSQKKEKKKAS